MELLRLGRAGTLVEEGMQSLLADMVHHILEQQLSNNSACKRRTDKGPPFDSLEALVDKHNWPVLRYPPRSRRTQAGHSVHGID